jgi:hypothetical protein
MKTHLENKFLSVSCSDFPTAFLGHGYRGGGGRVFVAKLYIKFILYFHPKKSYIPI